MVIDEEDIDSICYNYEDNNTKPKTPLILPHLSHEGRKTLGSILNSERELLECTYTHSRDKKKVLHKGTEEDPISYKEKMIDSYTTTFNATNVTFTREITLEINAQGDVIDSWDSWYNITAVKDGQELLNVDKEEPFDFFEKIEDIYL